MEEFDVAIIGAGISGCSLLYILSRYTNIKKIILIEKKSSAAMLNSHYTQNSQTLHFGEMMTNYNLKKALKIKKASTMIANFINSRNNKNLYTKLNKILIAIDEEEVKNLLKHYKKYKKFYPKIKLLNRDEIEKIEPNLIKKRPKSQKILAIKGEYGYTVNYKEISEELIKASQENKKIKKLFNTKVKNIKKIKGIYHIKTKNNLTIKSKVISVNAGPHSLYFAKKLGFGKEYGIIPVAGGFYKVKNLVKSKIYTMQIKNLPYAAIHADLMLPELKYTRLGPTAKPLPMLERRNKSTIKDFLKTSIWTINGIVSLINAARKKNVITYLFKQFFYDMPVIGRYIFIGPAKKLFPKLRAKDLIRDRTLGGIRPQIISTKSGIRIDDVKIIKKNIIFNISPPTGGSGSLMNATQQTKKIITFFKGKYYFNNIKHKKELLKKLKN